MDQCNNCSKPINVVFPLVICKKCGFSGCGRCGPSFKAAAICPKCKRGGALVAVDD